MMDPSCPVTRTSLWSLSTTGWESWVSHTSRSFHFCWCLDRNYTRRIKFLCKISQKISIDFEGNKKGNRKGKGIFSLLFIPRKRYLRFFSSKAGKLLSRRNWFKGNKQIGSENKDNEGYRENTFKKQSHLFWSTRCTQKYIYIHLEQTSGNEIFLKDRHKEEDIQDVHIRSWCCLCLFSSRGLEVFTSIERRLFLFFLSVLKRNTLCCIIQSLEQKEEWGAERKEGPEERKKLLAEN